MNTPSKELIHDIKKAISGGDLDKLKALLEADKARLTWTTPFGTWLHSAAMCGKLEIIKYLVEKGIDINRREGMADSGAICLAADKGNAEIVRYLIEHGAEFDVSDPVRNPLFGAIVGQSIECAKLLLEAGINARVRYTGERMKEMDAIAFAEERGEKKIAAFIRDYLERHPEEPEQK
jgi:uncharacterized protein